MNPPLRTATIIVSAAIALVPARAWSQDDKPCHPKNEPGLGPQWNATFGIGPVAFPLLVGDDPSSLETQMGEAGYSIPVAGGGFSSSIEYSPLYWLTVGAEIDYQMFFDKRDAEIDGVHRVSVVSGERGHGYSMHLLSATAFVQAGLRLFDKCKGEGFEMGLRFGGGGGGWFWRLRDETEAGAVGRLKIHAVTSLVRRGFSISWAFGIPFMYISSLGPAELSHGWTWGWEILVRFGWRWG